MRRVLATFATVFLALGVLGATPRQAVNEQPADLSRIDRAPGRQPIYQSDAAQYCLLVFGPQAKTRVWLAVDGDTLYVDRNGNGDLTDAGEAVAGSKYGFDIGTLVEPDGRTRHTSLVLERSREYFRITIDLHRLGTHYVGYDRADRLRFAGRPEEAPIVHFGGPLTMRFYRQPPRLVPGKRSRVNVSIGTPGLGSGTFAALQCRTVLDCKTAPLAEFEFPRRDPNLAPIRVSATVGDD